MTALKAARSFISAGFDAEGMPTVWTCELCIGRGLTSDTVRHSQTCRIGMILPALKAAREVAVYVRHLRKHSERSFELVTATAGFRSLLREFDDAWYDDTKDDA